MFCRSSLDKQNCSAGDLAQWLDLLTKKQLCDDMKICLVTFATTVRFKLNQYILNMFALRFSGITETSAWNFEKIKKEGFYQTHREILAHKRGAGYWLWKPYIILQELKKVNYGDYVVYSDCGRNKPLLSRSIKPLLEWCSANRGVLPGVYIPQYGASRKWTKRDCFVLMECDQKDYWNHCQIQASFSVWEKNEFSLSFVEKWLDHCTDARILLDTANTCGLPNFADFIEHRHDQSVLTLCAIKEKVRGLGDSLGPAPFCDNDKSIDQVLAKMGVPSVKSVRRIVLEAFVNCMWFLIASLRKLKSN